MTLLFTFVFSSKYVCLTWRFVYNRPIVSLLVFLDLSGFFLVMSPYLQISAINLTTGLLLLTEMMDKTSKLRYKLNSNYPLTFSIQFVSTIMLPRINYIVPKKKEKRNIDKDIHSKTNTERQIPEGGVTGFVREASTMNWVLPTHAEPPTLYKHSRGLKWQVKKVPLLCRGSVMWCNVEDSVKGCAAQIQTVQCDRGISRHETTRMFMSWTSLWHHNRGILPLPQSILPLKIPVHYQERPGLSHLDLLASDTPLVVQSTASLLFMKLLKRRLISYVHRTVSFNLI